MLQWLYDLRENHGYDLFKITDLMNNRGAEISYLDFLKILEQRIYPTKKQAQVLGEILGFDPGKLFEHSLDKKYRKGIRNTSVRRKWLYDLRKKKKLTQKYIADYIGVSMQTYAKYELGLLGPSEDNKAKLEQLLKTKWKDGLDEQGFDSTTKYPYKDQIVLRKLRDENMLPLTSVARELKIHTTSMSRYETGRDKLTEWHKAKLNKLFNIEL